MARNRLKRPAKRAIAVVRTELGLPEPGLVPETSRTQLLALSELMRRAAGDIAGMAEPSALTAFELRVFSQNGEDGVLAEILRRIGTTSEYFVEFGAADGVENNCALLAEVHGWSGVFMDAGDAEYEGLAHRYAASTRVSTAKEMVTPDRVQSLFARHGVPIEFDVLSIDVDGSDYWIWSAVTEYRPRVVVIEYNGALPPCRRLVQPRDHGAWSRTDFYGASIEALVALGHEKGYRLVHTELTGNNAFFIRDDLPGSFPPLADVPLRRSNFSMIGVRHLPDHSGDRYLDLETGRLA